MHDEMHWHKYKGAGMFVLGLLVLANVYWAHFDWATFIGAILALVGLLKLLMPMKKGRK